MIKLDLNQFKHFSFNTYLNLTLIYFHYFLWSRYPCNWPPSVSSIKSRYCCWFFHVWSCFMIKILSSQDKHNQACLLFLLHLWPFSVFFLYGKLIRSRFFDFARNDDCLVHGWFIHQQCHTDAVGHLIFCIVALAIRSIGRAGDSEHYHHVHWQ